MYIFLSKKLQNMQWCEKVPLLIMHVCHTSMFQTIKQMYILVKGISINQVNTSWRFESKVLYY